MVGARILTYLGISVFAMASVVAIYVLWENKIKNEALLMAKTAQLEQTVKDQEQFIESMKILQRKQDEISKKLDEQNRAIEQKLSEINTYLESKEAETSDRPSSKVLQETIKRLRQ